MNTHIIKNLSCNFSQSGSEPANPYSEEQIKNRRAAYFNQGENARTILFRESIQPSDEGNNR